MYKFSAKIKYALIGLSDIIIYGKKTFVPLSDIVRREKVPRVYMERLLAKLVKGGIIRSKKGSQGGFSLNKKLEDISMYKLYTIFHPDIEKKEDFQYLKNKKVQLIMEKMSNSINTQIADILRKIKFNMIPDIIKIKRKK